MDMHSVYIKARKDLVQQWTKLPFIAINDAIFSVLESWPPKWHAPDLVEMDKATTQKQKDATKLHVTMLVGKRHNEKVATEVRVVCEAARATAK